MQYLSFSNNNINNSNNNNNTKITKYKPIYTSLEGFTVPFFRFICPGTNLENNLDFQSLIIILTDKRTDMLVVIASFSQNVT